MWPEHCERAGVPAFALAALLLCAPVLANGLDLNRATRAQLEQLDGVGVLMAERLLQERAKAPFAGWDDLQARVKGIRGKRVQQLKRQGVRLESSTAVRNGQDEGRR